MFRFENDSFFPRNHARNALKYAIFSRVLLHELLTFAITISVGILALYHYFNCFWMLWFWPTPIKKVLHAFHATN